MILDYLGKPVAYDRLLDLLRIDPEIGTPASNIRNLATLGLDVLYAQGTLADILLCLESNHPCIAFVNTGELPYWNETTGHAVVVVGIDDNMIYLNDPAFTDAPKVISQGDFLLAWLEADEYYARIRRS
jgi:ABC-type bacteriocin/lantibiotic exporter with double-glycine peptidase domain